MINLDFIANDAIQGINEDLTASLYKFKAYTTSGSGKRSATYETAVSAKVQCQGTFSAKELSQIAGLNIQGARQAVYIKGNWQGVIRADQTGGDKLSYADIPGGDVKDWLIVHILESWPDFTKVVVAQQI